MQKTGLFLLLVVASLVLASTAFAGQADQNTGCGLGTLLWEGNADGSVLSQTLQATTNGTSGNQTFGITSGTLGCDKPASIVKNDKALSFTADNMDLLARDVAAGQGQTLEALAELMSLPMAERALVYSTLQAHFSQIFVTGDETAGVVLDRITTYTL